ncbi:hypothetical protein IQ07DRAFT_522738 [Pyrenochaeta sp. DS3sAY3a]|nr:hypothetical protein IQ07DRAFT_522738 [Pyrenochaeta sp. DS3sAY3a]
MEEIYRSAVGVVVCLTTHDFAHSTTSCRSVRAMECIRRVYENVPELDKFLTSKDDSACVNWEADWDLKRKVHFRLHEYLVSAIRDKAFRVCWLDVLRMRSMPWFSRVWVLQEYACHENVIFLFASQHIDGKVLAAVLLTYLWDRQVPSMVDHMITQLHASEGLITQCDQSDSSDTSPARHWLSLNSYVYNTLRIKSYAPQQRRCIVDLLNHSRISIASDKRDHVYSCLGLASDTYGIKPYYKPDLSAEALFTHVMRLILLNTQDINIIQCASTALGNHSESLPSWVPDWSESRQREDAQYYNFYEGGLRAGGDTCVDIEFLDDGTTLQTKGVLLDTLVVEIKEQVWRGQRADIVNTFNNPRGRILQPDAHISPKPPKQGDEVWILYGSALPFLLRRVGTDYLFLRPVFVQSIDGTNVGSGEFMELKVDLATQTKTLRIR